MSKEVFEQARRLISASTVEYFTSSPSAEWRGNEYFTLNPLRGDKKIGSFHINDVGQYFDHADGSGGDLIELVSKIKSCTLKEAAEEIIRASGRPVDAPEPQRKPKPQKIKAIIPVTDIDLKKLNSALKEKLVQEKYGPASNGWTYRDAQGGAVFCITRHNRADGGKDILPWYFGEDQKWHTGQPLDNNRPIYKSDQIARDKVSPVLIVEGEKCASVEIPGYIVVTWQGGTNATAKTDWSLLDGREVIVWPDADEVGLKAAQAIQRRLPHAKILDVSNKPKGWDLADAVAEGIDPIAFIAGAMQQDVKQNRPDDGLPFLALGADNMSHYFLRRDSRVIFPVQRGHFNAAKAIEIAPKSYWAIEYASKTGDGIRITDIYDYLVDLSVQTGTYDHNKIRGAGVWRDRDGIVLNDGQRLVMPDGKAKKYDDHRSEFTYVKSSVRFGPMSGPESTDEDGKMLEELFKAQSWVNSSMAPLAMGWSLIAPFGGMLKWRPHIWLTGSKGTGKSYMLENLIYPLCGPFTHRGSGKDTEAGIRRALNIDARPVILDEMEPKSPKAREKISSLLELARNASSDGSGVITIGGGADGGAMTFVIRSCFAFASVTVPDEDAAISSRIIRMELKVEKNQSAKFKRCAPLYEECMQDPSRYTRRIYRALPRILADIEWIRSNYLGAFGEQRRVDQVAPLLASAWAVQSQKMIRETPEGMEWIAEWIGWLSAGPTETLEDEDAVVKHLISAQIRTDDGVNRTVAELLQDASTNVDSAEKILSRHGMRIIRQTNGSVLAISSENQHVKKILSGTQFESGYGSQLKRNKLCVNESKTVRFASGQSRAVLIDWHGFKSLYLDDLTNPELPEEAF